MRSLTILLIFLTSRSLFAVGISISGNGNDNKLIIKALPTTNSVIVNYDDNTDEVDFTSNDNTAQIITNPLDTTGDGSDGNPHVTTNDDGSNNYVRIDEEDWETLDSVFDNPNRQPTTGFTSVDTDDDVPMLTEIKSVLESYRDKLDAIAQEETLLAFSNEFNSTRGEIGEANFTRKATLADISNSVVDIRGWIYDENDFARRTQLSDLYDQLASINENLSEETETNSTDLNVTEITQETLDERIEEMQEASEPLSALGENTGISTPLLQGANTNLNLTWEFLNGSQSFDLFNMHDATGFNLPSLADVAFWIKKFLAWVIAFLFILAMKNAGLQVLEDIPKFTTNAPVTNWSILGNSAGAIVAKSTYLVILVAFIGIIGTNLAIINDESQLLGQTSLGINLIGQGLADLASGHGFMSTALKYLVLFVPVASIFSTIATFYTFKFTTWILINIQVMSMRAVS